jgi:signal transduction histidine kinase
MAGKTVGRFHLPVLGALLLLAVLAEDLRRSFALLHPGALLLAALLGAGLALRETVWIARGGGLRPVRLMTLILSLAALAVAVNTLAYQARIRIEIARWENREWFRLSDRTDDLRAAFNSLVESASVPIGRARSLARRNPRSGDPRSLARAQEILDLIAPADDDDVAMIGVSIYREDGQALAWTGPARTLPRELLVRSVPRDSIRWLMVDENGLWRLVGLARPWSDSEELLVVELLVRSAYDPEVLDRALRVKALLPDRDRITFLSYRRPALELEDLFDRLGDSRRLPADELLAVNVALRADDGTLLGHATLRGRSVGEIREEIETAHSAAGNLILALAGAMIVGSLLLPRRVSTGVELRLHATRIASIWIFRAHLLFFPLPSALVHPSLDDAGLFARAGLFGLLRSPLDFLLTSAAILATGVLMSLMITRGLPFAPARGRVRAVAFLVLALLTAFLLGTRLPHEALKVVENTRVDIMTVEVFNPETPRVTLQTAAAFSLLGVVIPLVTLLWASVWAASRSGDSGPPPPPDPTARTLRWLALLVLPCAVLTAFILELAFQPAVTSHLKGFLRNDLTLFVRWISLQRRMSLRDSVTEIRQFTGLAERIEAAPDGGDPTLALELWQTTPLAGRGYAGSLTVTDDSGRSISRFSRNFPSVLDHRGREPVEIPEGTISEFRTAIRGLAVEALHVHTEIRTERGVAGAVTIHLRDDFGDLPGLSPPSPLQEARGEDRPLTRLLPSWNPHVGLAVYREGVAILAKPRDPPPPPPKIEMEQLLSDFRETWWQERHEGGMTWHDLFFSSRDQLVALSFPEPGAAGRIARAIRLSAQTVIALVLLVTPWGFASGLRLGWRPSPARLIGALTRTHYRRLVGTFLVAALAPLTLLALALTNFVKAEVAQDVREHGWTVLGPLRRQVEDFGRTEEFGGAPDDAFLFSLSEESAEDLSLFSNGVLHATSDREIYEMGILPERLPGEVHRRLSLEGRRVVLDQTMIGGHLYHRIHGLVALGPPHDGVLTILLAAENPEISRRARQIYDVMLITYASVILFMGVVAYILARRIAGPIRNLSQAAARIAAGDLRAEVAPTARDETGDLVEAFNAMARALRRQHDDLEERGNYIGKILLNATTGVLSVDLEGRVVTFNPAAVAILGFGALRPGESLPARLAERADFHPIGRALGACLSEPFRTRELEAEFGDEESRRHARVKIVPFTEGAGLLIFIEDVTETVRSNRLATWAEMARRIAHEIKNPLTPIKLSADHIRRVYADGSDAFPRVLDECLQTVDEQVANLRTIATQFSAYARHPEIRKEPTPVKEFLEGVVRPYKAAPPEGITIECRIDGANESMEVDRTIFSQAIVNIIENAIQAMPEGGTLMVEASVPDAHSPPRLLDLTVSDTGVGMDKEALARAFEPYFSTKGSGTGLGMVIARRAIEEHQGTIELTSAPGLGTSARIRVPLG